MTYSVKSVPYVIIMLVTHNATSETTTDDASFYKQNATNIYMDWGMVLRGIAVSSSQVFAVDSVAAGSVIYLAILIYSPTTAAFSFLGALVGSVAGLELGAEYDEIYNGSWGYNSLLTGAALGGNLLVLNGQTTVATIVAILYTALVQYCVQLIFKKMELPILTLPFVVVVSLFLKLRKDKQDLTFPRPLTASFPEKQRYDYLANRSASSREVDTSEEPELIIQNGKRTTPADN